MSKQNQKKTPYLNKKVKKAGMKEQMIYGSGGTTLSEVQEKKKKYKNNKLNE